VGAFIFSKDGYLLLGESNRGTYEGMWIIPGGGIEEGESQEQALLREIFEETGIDISNEAIEKMDISLTGESKKILKETGEEVIGKYKFYNYIIRLKQNYMDVPLIAGDDYSNPTWHKIEELKNLKLPEPSIVSLKKMGIL
jgi:8-oxo-dGTP pyrophosphatase MutT (NUDIX family)